MAAETALEAPSSPAEPTLPGGDTTTAAPSPKAPETAPEKVPEKPDALSGLLDRYTSLQAALSEAYGPAIRDASKAVTEAETKAAQTSESVLRPAIEGVKAAASVPVPPLPKMAPEPPVPDRRPRPFLSSPGGESAVNAMVTGLGLLAQLAMGGRAPVAALGALSGAMNGWAAGDATRADREWKQYLQTVDSIRHENKQALTMWEAAMQASGTNVLQAEARYKASTAEAGLADKWATVAQGGMGRLLEMLKYEQGLINGVFDRSAKVMEMQIMNEMKEATNRNTAAFREAQLAQVDRRLDETERSNREKAQWKREAGADIMKSLPANVRAELLADPDVKKIVESGEGITSDQIARALEKSNARQEERAKNVGLNAANIPQRTPTESMRRLEDMTVAQGQVREMERLADSKDVNLSKVVGGVRPWFNQIAQTGKAGPFPIPESARNTMTDDERRFLALTQDYADTILRLRSGAAINEQEFKRMLMFIPEQSVTPATFRARLKLQEDLITMKKGTVIEYLEKGGYRAPKVEPPPVKRDATTAAKPPKAGMVRAKRKSDGAEGWIDPKDIGEKYEAVGGR